MTYEQIKLLKPADFKRLCGVSKDTFDKMCEVVRQDKQSNSTRGRRAKLSLENPRVTNSLFLARVPHTIPFGNGLELARIARFAHRAPDWGYSHQVGRVFLAGQKTLARKHDQTIHDCRCHRITGRASEKKQRRFYSGKKKRQTQKAQVIVAEETGEVVATAFANGKMHDYKLFKRSKVKFAVETELLADSGYQGAQKEHARTCLPQKKSKKRLLTKEERRGNRELSSRRVRVENAIRRLKIFRILGERYRHRRTRFGLRFNLIAGLCNHELKLKQWISQEV